MLKISTLQFQIDLLVILSKLKLSQELSLFLAQHYGTVPVPIRNAETILTFRKLLKSHLFDLAFPP